MKDCFQTDMLMIYMDENGRCIYELDSSYIVSYLKQKGLKAKLLTNYEMFGITELVNQILSYKPRTVVFVLHENNFHAINRVSEELKRRVEELFIIAGGTIATFAPEKVLKFAPSIDVCYINEGEETVLELVESIKHGEDYSQTSICYRDESGIIKKTPIRPLHERLDDYDSPYLSGVIDPVAMFEKNRMVTVLLSRGCVFNCKFCNWMAIRRRGIRYHSVDRVIEELKFILLKLKDSKKTVQVRFMDDLFTANKNTIKELCRRIQEENLKFEFRFHTRPDCIDEELIRILHEAGCTRMSFGLESAVPEILHSMGKVNSKSDNDYEAEKRYIEKTKEVVQYANKYNVESIVNVICGWYKEDINDIKRTIEYVKEIKAARYFPAIITYFAGTEAYKEVEPLVAEHIKELERKGEPVFNLTYKTCPSLYQYNPYELDHLENDQPALYKLKDRKIIQQIMGIGFEKHDNRQLFLSYRNDLKFDWVVRNMLLTTQISLISESENCQIISYPKMIYGYECVEDGEYANESHAENRLKSRIITIDDLISGQQIEKYSILRLRNSEDIDTLYDYLSQLSIQDFTELFSSNGKAMFIQDFCMLTDSCQACNASRLYAKENGQICTCIHGTEIGNIKEDISLDKIQKQMVQYREKEYEIRGCRECELVDKCAKCLYVDNIGRDEYCRIQKDAAKRRLFKRISKIMTMDYYFS